MLNLLTQVLDYLHIDATMQRTVLTASTDKCPGPLELHDHWCEIPRLSDIAEYLEGFTEEWDYGGCSRKQLDLTLADLVRVLDLTASLSHACVPQTRVFPKGQVRTVLSEALPKKNLGVNIPTVAQSV